MTIIPSDKKGYQKLSYRCFKDRYKAFNYNKKDATIHATIGNVTNKNKGDVTIQTVDNITSKAFCVPFGKSVATLIFLNKYYKKMCAPNPKKYAYFQWSVIIEIISNVPFKPLITLMLNLFRALLFR